jgi:hypothetical protein
MEKRDCLGKETSKREENEGRHVYDKNTLHACVTIA